MGKRERERERDRDGRERYKETKVVERETGMGKKDRKRQEWGREREQ